jgi:hypothetical protein
VCSSALRRDFSNAKEHGMESCLRFRNYSVKCAATANFASNGVNFSDDKDLLKDLFPEPHMTELVNELIYALGEVERFLSTIQIR